MKLISSLSKLSLEPSQRALDEDRPYAFPEYPNWEQRYPINEEFYSIQGEGLHTGVPMYFVRLQGCTVGCYFCDTKYTWRPEKDIGNWSRLEEILNRTNKKMRQGGWICLTGGEPFEHDLRALLARFHRNFYNIHIETSGQYLPDYLLKIRGKNDPCYVDYLCVSPKDLFSVKKLTTHPYMLAMADEIKCVVTKKSDIDYYLQNFLFYNSVNRPLILQPVDNDPRLSEVILDSIKEHEFVRMMIQQHKVMKLR